MDLKGNGKDDGGEEKQHGCDCGFKHSGLALNKETSVTLSEGHIYLTGFTLHFTICNVKFLSQNIVTDYLYNLITQYTCTVPIKKYSPLGWFIVLLALIMVNKSWRL